MNYFFYCVSNVIINIEFEENCNDNSFIIKENEIYFKNGNTLKLSEVKFT